MFLTRLSWFLAAGLLALSADVRAAADRLAGPYRAALEEVVDGDTLNVRVTVWLGQELSVAVRVRGIDAPERHGKCASERQRAEAATAALARLVAARKLVLSDIEGDKYFGRVIAHVEAAGVDVGAALLAGGHARAYDGGARGGWCEIGALEAAPWVADARPN
jgi:endonuclease YncB( thermonuclease family)